MLALIGAALVACGFVWAWGGIAGLVFGRGWPGLGAGQLLGVLVRLPTRLARPAQAWPAAQRAELPGAGGFYAALSLLCAAAVGRRVYRRGHAGRRRLGYHAFLGLPMTSGGIVG